MGVGVNTHVSSTLTLTVLHLSDKLQKKSWATRTDPNQHYLNRGRHTRTVYGCVGESLAKPVYMFALSTNKIDYIRFLHLVARSVRSTTGVKPILVYDGHPAHRSRECLAVANLYFRPLQQCSYSCCFNSVEAVWGVAKKDYMKRLLLANYEISLARFLILIDQSLQSISPAVHRGILRSNHDFVRKHLALQAADE